MNLLSTPLLRSFIRFGEEDETALIFNLTTIRGEVEPGGVDKAILAFVGEMYDKTHTIPSFTLVRRSFADRPDDGTSLAAVARLDSLSQTATADAFLDPSVSTVVSEPPPFLSGPEFRYELDAFKTAVTQEVTSRMLLEASTILSTGVRAPGGKTLKGTEAAIDHLSARINELNLTFKRGVIEGSFRRDAHKVRKQYTHWKENQADTVGCLTGLDRIDAVHRGPRNGDLVLVAGFVSHMKTSLCMNWLYNTSILFGRNCGVVSLETQIPTLRMLLYVMHSGHSKFRDQGIPPLDHEKVTSGSLTPDEEAFFEVVIDDFENSPDYGDIIYKEPEDEITVADIKRWAEGKHRTLPLDMLCVDYLGLVSPEKGKSSLDANANLNKVIRQAKTNLAMSFDNGRGIVVLSPHQTNRSGLLEAEKNAGKYKINALANTNEAERSADFIYTTYLDDVLRNSRELVMGNLKARNKPLIQDTWKVFADPTTRIISNIDTSGGGAELVTI